LNSILVIKSEKHYFCQLSQSWHEDRISLTMRALISAFFLLLLLVLSPLTAAQEAGKEIKDKLPWRLHTLFSVECQDYFDWQTVGLVHSLRRANHPGPVTRLLSCTEDELSRYRGMNLVPTMVVPSMSRHPRTGDW
jgi:peptidyl serine alpha-galactosyltransferase